MNLAPWDVTPYWQSQPGVRRALDTAATRTADTATRAERTLALLAGIAVGGALVGWALARDWEK